MSDPFGNRTRPFRRAAGRETGRAVAIWLAEHQWRPNAHPVEFGSGLRAGRRAVALNSIRGSALLIGGGFFSGGSPVAGASPIVGIVPQCALGAHGRAALRRRVL